MPGIYIHIPFCKSRCKYCDFFSTTHLTKQSEYVEALLCEWEDRRNTLTQYTIDNTQYTTLYIGGGTPSTLSITNLQRLLSHFPQTNEMTMEANPGDITREKVRAWRELGINRLSIGIQSFQDELLQLVGRRHNAQQAIEAVAIAQEAGFDNISIDLMYALPSQTMEQWKSDVKTALKLGVQHISSYGLIYEDGTALTTLLDHGLIEAVDEETEMQMYDYLVDELTKNSFQHYEVSNFALPGRESKHNSSYWNDTPYLGLGAGAHSYDGTARRWNISDLEKYIEQAKTHQLQPEEEVLTPQQRHTEHVMLSLRTSRGISTEDIDISKAEKYLKQGLLRQENNRIMATTKGFHILNRIIEDVLD